MVPELEKSWSNLVLEERDSESQDRTWLWAHEWHKHGICAQRCDPKIQSERDYFSLAIALYNKFDVAQALSQASLTPQPAEGAVEIETDKVRAAIVKAFGKQPTLQCYNDRDSGRSYLADIAICVDKENRELIDCPGGAAIDYTRGFESCPARVHYPTMPR
jgi:ribonuclease T2